MGGDANATDDVTTTPTDGGNDPDLARTYPLQPLARERGGQPEEDDGHGKHPDYFAQAPVIRGTGDAAK